MFTKITVSLSLVFLVSCASNRDQAQHKESPHHHHSCKMDKCEMKHKCEMFAKKCAMSVSHGDFHVEGKEEFTLTHEGHRYFFSSKEKMKEFKKNIGQNIKKANTNWNRFEAMSSRR